MQSQAGAYRLVLPTHLTVDNLLSADQCVVTVIIIDESKKSSTWLKAADSETKLYLPQRWLSSLTVLKEEKERKGGSTLDLIY